MTSSLRDPIIRVQRGSAEEIHNLDPFAPGAAVEGPEIWICEFESPTLVLGSRQQDSILELERCAELELSVARRRSGGGAVLMYPDEVVWIDLVLPHGVTADDVRASMVQVGEWWLTALAPFTTNRGMAVEAGGELRVHRGAMEHGPWSSLVCFAGIGPGEVVDGGHKLVGLSQRRTRAGIRVQGMVHRRSAMSVMARLFRGELPTEPLDDPAWLPTVCAAEIAESLRCQVERQLTSV